ncbi:MAG: hypothetical protein QOG64_2108 [Acidimicrobiaceae bacterium]|nr:hypothetical protein [Acidimicrobiaceae bacterium]
MDLDYAEVERELCRIPEVNAARIVTNGDGRPTEVHVLASPEKHAKQVVRDIQSVAMATYGLELDRRVISVVQLEGNGNGNGHGNGHTVAPEAADADADAGDADADADAGEAAATAAATTATESDGIPASVLPLPILEDDRVVVDSVVSVRSGVGCVVEVTLRRGAERVTGSAEGTVATTAMMRLVAQATLSGLRQLLPAADRADVETASVLRLGERSVALATVVIVVPPYEEVMAGSAMVRAAGDHDAIARAVLDAVNRRLTQLP